jgi:hypothetical protein
MVVMTPISKAGADARPKLEIKERVFDFGTVSQGTVVSHDFVVRNEGESNLIIQRIIPSCGCTAAAVSGDPILPGQERAIKVSFDTAGFSGEKYKTIRVNTNDIDNLSVVLALRGIVEPDVVVEPQSLMFGEVVRGTKESRPVRVSLKGGAKIVLTGARIFSPHLEVMESDRSATSAVFNVTLLASAPPGELRDRLVIGLKGAQESTINVPIFAVVKGAVAFEPPQLTFGVIEGATTLQKNVKIVNRGEGAIRVVEARSSHPAISVEVREVKPGKNFVLQVKVDPSKVSKDLRASVEVQTEGAEESTLTLSVFGILPPKQSAPKQSAPKQSA